MAEADNLDEHKVKREKYGDGYSPNPHLSSLPHDFLYHLGLDTNEDNFEELFGDVKFVIMGGSPSRMKAFSEFLADRMKMNADEKDKLDISRTDRYHMFKIGPVLAISHGMGVPSVTILLHEIFKLLHYAKCSDVCLVRLGTCGGIGIPPGTVVVSKKVLNAKLKEEHDLYILGKLVSRQAKLDIGLAEEIVESQNDPSIRTVLGTTMCTDDFYEGQGRVDGALCDYSYQDRVDYIKKLKEAGVTNIEMEATVIGSLCNYVGIPGGIVCVSLLNRMKGDQVTITKEEYSEYQRRLQTVVANFILNRIARSK